MICEINDDEYITCILGYQISPHLEFSVVLTHMILHEGEDQPAFQNLLIGDRGNLLDACSIAKTWMTETLGIAGEDADDVILSSIQVFVAQYPNLRLER